MPHTVPLAKCSWLQSAMLQTHAGMLPSEPARHRALGDGILLHPSDQGHGGDTSEPTKRADCAQSLRLPGANPQSWQGKGLRAAGQDS